MQLKLILPGALLIPALLLAGCGMGTMSDVTANMDSPEINGQAFGGQAPISGAEIEVVSMGTTGYGSAGSVLARTTTDASGSFQFASGAYTCPQSNTPVYLLAIGGDAGSGNNLHIANAAGLGTCTNAKSSFVVVNEVTTVALAYSLAHFFTTTIGGNNPVLADGDWFGGPSTISGGTVNYARGMVLGNSFTIPALVNNATGKPNASTSTATIESAKIYTIANILAACVNTSGSTSTGQPCRNLFDYTTIGTTAPYDTLQAAVEIALSQYSISAAQSASTVSKLYTLGTPPNPAFGGGLTGTPNDFTIGISYTSSAFGLGITNGYASTLDIDSSNRIWFPSNAAGKTGAGYFDPTSRTFSGPFASVSSPLVFPIQVAIDQSGFAWYNDIGSSNVDGFLTTSPTTVKAFSLLLSTSNALTIGEDNKVNVGITGAGNNYELANINAARTTYTVESGTSAGFAYPITSIAADRSLENGVSTTLASTTALHDYLVTPTIPATVISEVTSTKDDSGQVIYVGSNPDNGTANEFIGTRPFSSSSNGTIANDGLCIFSLGKCKAIKGGNTNSPVGIAIDGAKNLWLPESANGGLLQVTPTGNSGVSPYTNAGGGVPNSEYLHGTGNGGTLTIPYGVAIDNAGNVWISNAGCTSSLICTPGNFTLSEIVGAAAPTITPISAQNASGVNLTGTEPQY